MTIVFLYDGFMELREAYEAALTTTATSDFWEEQPGAWITAITLTVIVIEESKEFAWPLWELMKGNAVMETIEESVEEIEEVVEEEELAWDITDCIQYEDDADYFGCLDLCAEVTGESCE